MSRVIAIFLSALFAVVAMALPARADDAAEFMARFSGKWVGTGQLLIGSENGVEFLCELKGSPSATQLTFAMTGTCRMGSLSAPIHAQLRYNADTNQFYGQFLGGAEKGGADIVGARDGDGFSLKLASGPTQGRLAAETLGTDQLKVVIYFSDPRSTNEVPVVAMGLTRRDVITGAIDP